MRSCDRGEENVCAEEEEDINISVVKGRSMKVHQRTIEKRVY